MWVKFLVKSLQARPPAAYAFGAMNVGERSFILAFLAGEECERFKAREIGKTLRYTAAGTSGRMPPEPARKPRALRF